MTNYTLFGIVAKGNQPAQTIISRRANTTTSYVYKGGPICAGRQHHIGPPYHVYRCPHRPQPVLATNYTLFGIVAKGNQTAQAIGTPTYDSTTSYVSGGGPSWAGRLNNIGPPYRVYRCHFRPQPVLVTNYTLFGIVAKGNQPAQTIVLRRVIATTTYMY